MLLQKKCKDQRIFGPHCGRPGICPVVIANEMSGLGVRNGVQAHRKRREADWGVVICQNPVRVDTIDIRVTSEQASKS